MTGTAVGAVRVDASGATDVGRKRPLNEDHFIVLSLQKSVKVQQTSLPDQAALAALSSPEGLLFMVADGVGSRRGGGQASEAAITALVEYLGKVAGCYQHMDTDQEQDFLAQLEAAVHEAHRRVTDAHGGNPDSGPATTLTMAMLVWPRAYIVQVGDSRAFYLRKGRLRQLTRDQTMGEFMVDSGAWTEEQASRAPMARTLSSAIGSREVTPAVGLVDLQPGDVLLLCSDGLTRHVADDQIAALLGQAPDAASTCRALVNAALEGGGHDNVTVIVAKAVPA